MVGNELSIKIIKIHFKVVFAHELTTCFEEAFTSSQIRRDII